jgi:hypothetical protein
LETGAFFTPAPASAFLRDDIDRSDVEFIEAIQMLDIDLMQFSLDIDKLTLTQIYNTPSYLSETNSEKIKPYLKGNSIIFSWTKTHFKQ